MKTLIKNGRVVTAVDDYRADIFIDGETVTTIGKRLDMEADVVLDAWGKLVIPGGIDPLDAIKLPFGGTQASDDFYGCSKGLSIVKPSAIAASSSLLSEARKIGSGNPAFSNDVRTTTADASWTASPVRNGYFSRSRCDSAIIVESNG